MSYRSGDDDDDDEYYIGLYKQSPTINGWPTYWLDGSTSTYRIYDSGEPDDDDDYCFMITPDSNGKFMDCDCDDDRRYVCKITNGEYSNRSVFVTVHVIVEFNGFFIDKTLPI